MNHLLLRGDARRIPLADQSVHCVVTSPPYWGLRDYGVGGQIGMESTPDDFVASMVAVFREVWRVLRNDGTLWLNLGDSYNGYYASQYATSLSARNQHARQKVESGEGLRRKGLKPKDLVGIPWRVALALQDDGWYLRSDIIWAKPNPMPESVSDRPTRAHEFIFLFTKSDRYFYDADAIAERAVSDHPSGNGFKRPARLTYQDECGARGNDAPWEVSPTRNARTVWTIPVRGFPDAHFATFPTSLPERCIKAGTSERGCCSACGKPWRRVTGKERVPTRSGRTSKIYVDPENSPYERHSGSVVGNRDPFRHITATKTKGWEPMCSCDAGDPIPAVVFDPFNGAATTGVVAAQLGRRYIGSDLNPDYLAMSAKRMRNPFAAPSRTKQSAEDFPLFAGMDA